MAVRKETAPLPWEKYKDVRSYAQFVDMFKTWDDIPGMDIWKGAPSRFLAYMDKYKANLSKYSSPWNPSEDPNRTRVSAADAAKADVGRSASVIQRNQYANQLATIKKNLLAAQDSQTLYNRATNKTGLKDYTSTISSLKAEMEKIQAALAKLK